MKIGQRVISVADDWSFGWLGVVVGIEWSEFRQWIGVELDKDPRKPQAYHRKDLVLI